jgi:hypothetical protein
VARKVTKDKNSLSHCEYVERTTGLANATITATIGIQTHLIHSRPGPLPVSKIRGVNVSRGHSCRRQGWKVTGWLLQKRIGFPKRRHVQLPSQGAATVTLDKVQVA